MQSRSMVQIAIQMQGKYNNAAAHIKQHKQSSFTAVCKAHSTMNTPPLFTYIPISKIAIWIFYTKLA